LADAFKKGKKKKKKKPGGEKKGQGTAPLSWRSLSKGGRGGGGGNGRGKKREGERRPSAGVAQFWLLCCAARIHIIAGEGEKKEKKKNRREEKRERGSHIRMNTMGLSPRRVAAAWKKEEGRKKGFRTQPNSHPLYDSPGEEGEGGKKKRFQFTSDWKKKKKEGGRERGHSSARRDIADNVCPLSRSRRRERKGGKKKKGAAGGFPDHLCGGEGKNVAEKKKGKKKEVGQRRGSTGITSFLT